MLKGRSRAAEEGSKADAQAVMNAMMDCAQKLLRERGGFAPFAAWMDGTGAAALDTSEAINEQTPARAVAERMTERLRSRIAQGGVRVAAIAADVRFARRGSDEMREAVELHMEHQDGYCVDIYLPYRLKKNRWGKGHPWRVRWVHPVAQESAHRFWG